MTKETTVATPIKPVSINVIAPGYQAFQQAAVHIRESYVFHPDLPVQILPNGNAMFTLVIGNPTQTAIDMAREAADQALRLQAIQYERDVKAAAERLVAQQKREELEKQVADAVAANEKAIAKLRKDAQAELDKLSQ